MKRFLVAWAVILGIIAFATLLIGSFVATLTYAVHPTSIQFIGSLIVLVLSGSALIAAWLVAD